MSDYPLNSHNLVFPEAMSRIDQRTIEAGTPGIALMERAGAAVVSVIRSRWTRRPVRVLCGPGQNGGDGWVIARRLREAGWPVEIYSDWPADKLSGDAATAAQRSAWPPRPLIAASEGATSLMIIVDAIFGAGLSRDIEGRTAEILQELAKQSLTIVAVDLPSGIDGRTGDVRGVACPADATVTFGWAKPGHMLGKGRAYSGDLFVRPIGLEGLSSDSEIDLNSPYLWSDQLPFPPQAAHKYARGGVLVMGGSRHQGGAARLAAHAAAKAGAGAVTIATSGAAMDIYASQMDEIMLKRADDPVELVELAKQKFVASIIIGPGLTTEEHDREMVLAVAQLGKPTVLDASALSMFENDPEELFNSLPTDSVLTPHEGEFSRLFPDLTGDALTRCKAAVDRIGRTIVLKGASSIIVSPGERPIINTHATPYLATAGSGDTLAGIIGALMAQGLQPHWAAASGVWIHGEAGRQNGPGLTADTLATHIPGAILKLSKDSVCN